MKVTKGSIMWKLATDFGYYSVPKDFCSLTRRIMFTALKWVFVLGVSTYVVGNVLGATIAFLVTGVYITSAWLLLIPVIFAIVLIVLIICLAALAAGLVIAAITGSTKVFLTFVGPAYRSWKEKYCPIVKELDK